MEKYKFRKGDVCLIKDFQEFGSVLMQLHKPIDKNIEDEPISRLWYGFILDAKDKDFLSYVQDNQITDYWIFLSSEKNLILIETPSVEE